MDEERASVVQRMLAGGMSPEAVAAEVAIDATVIDRQKKAAALGLLAPSAHDATRRWVRTELIHAASFGRRWSAMDPEDLRLEFEAALREVFGG